MKGETMKREGDKATIIQHCAMFGNLKTEVRKFDVGEVKPHAQHKKSVYVSFIKPRERRSYYYLMVPDNVRYITIERDGKVLYDSRTDVPCDMAAWQKSYDEHKGNAWRGL